MNETQPQDDIIDVEPHIINESKAEKPPRKLWLRILPPIGVGLVCAVAGSWIYRDLLSNYFPSDQVTALTTRVATMESTTKDNQKRIDAIVALTEELKAKLSAAQASADKSAKLNADTSAQLQNSTADVATLKQDLEKLSAATAEVQSKLAAGAGGATVAVDPTIATRLAQLEKQMSAAPSAPAEVADQSANLKSLKTQIAAGQNYSATLAPLARALPAAPGLDILGAERAGLANAASLTAELDALRATLPKPVVQPEETGVWASIKGFFSKLVKVRGQGADDWATAAAKASAFAAAGDLDQASGVFIKSNSPVPAPLKTWADKAQRRLSLEKALDSFAAALTRAGLAKE